MKITAIELQQKDQNRVSLYLDNQFAFGLVADLVWEHKLKVGQDIDQSKIDQLRQADNLHRAYQKALNYIAVRPRSAREMAQYLRQKLIYAHPDYKKIDSNNRSQFIEQQQLSVDKIMEKLIQANYIDDVAFAKWWIDNRQAFKPRGRRLLLAELKHKGISDQDIQSALTTPDMTGHFEDQHQSTTELAGATTVAQKYIKKQAELDPNKLRHKLARHLASKGYDWDIINQVWSDYTAELNLPTTHFDDTLN